MWLLLVPIKEWRCTSEAPFLIFQWLDCSEFDVVTLTISILWCIRKMMQSFLCCHAANCLAILYGICSSWSKFWWHDLWTSHLPTSINGAAIPCGSYAEFNDDNILGLVKGFFFMCTWSFQFVVFNVPKYTQCSLLSGIVSSNLLSGASCHLSFCGINISSSLLLLTNLVNLKPSTLYMLLIFFDRLNKSY